MKKLLIAFMLVFMLTGAAQAATLDFDDLSTAVENSISLAGYGGFSWDNGGALHKDYHPDSGYTVGTVSGDYCAYNRYGDPLTITRVGGSTFDFNSAYLTAAWDDTLVVTLAGYLDSVEIYSVDVDLSTTAAQFFTFDFLGIDTLVMTSNPTTHFAMDNFTYNEAVSAVPEPSTVALLLAGFAGLIGFGLKRRS